MEVELAGESYTSRKSSLYICKLTETSNVLNDPANLLIDDYIKQNPDFNPHDKGVIFLCYMPLEEE